MVRVYLFALVALAAWSAWFFQFQIARYLGRSWDIGNAGSWGDTFGALNALFAAAAAIGVIWTLTLQRQQNERQEREIRSQSARIAAQERLQHIAGFESSFFQLLSLLRELKREYRYARYGIPVEHLPNITGGAPAFKAAYDDLSQSLKSASSNGRPISRNDVASLYTKSIHRAGEDVLGPYYRLVYTLMRRVSEDPVLNSSEKARYGNILRSQLGSSEVGLIGANGLTKASNNLHDFVVEFRMLKYLPKGPIHDALRQFYPRQAFEARD